MATTTSKGRRVFEGLSIVALDGFEGGPEYEGQVDAPGSANWLCERYGMAPDAFDTGASPGILWTDYDSWPCEPRAFSVLIDSDEVEALVGFAGASGYSVRGVEPISEPTAYGDGGGTVEILKHRDGWVILD